jgi:hypothetical protein
MLRAQWPLSRGRPVIEVALILAQGGQQITRRLIADTGVGSLHSAIELLLDEHDCLLCGGTPTKRVVLGGAYVGSYPVYALRISIPALGLDETVSVAGLPASPTGFDGIACFRFLNRFSYGNFAAQDQFGLEI